MARLHDDWCLLFISFRCGNLAGCEQYVLQRWHVATMRCKGTQKTLIIETFDAT